MGVLKADVAEVFSIAKDYPVKGAHPKFGEIDLSTISLEGAKQLVNAGFEGLVLKPSKSSKADK